MLLKKDIKEKVYWGINQTDPKSSEKNGFNWPIDSRIKNKGILTESRSING